MLYSNLMINLSLILNKGALRICYKNFRNNRYYDSFNFPAL